MSSDYFDPDVCECGHDWNDHSDLPSEFVDEECLMPACPCVAYTAAQPPDPDLDV